MELLGYGLRYHVAQLTFNFQFSIFNFQLIK